MSSISTLNRRLSKIERQIDERNGRTSQERVEECIQRVMIEHPGDSPKALALYFEAVHQELAPLARELEQQRDAAWEESRAIRKAINADQQEATSDEVERVVAQRDKLLGLVKRSHLQIMAWAEQYGNHNPEWLPPAGDVRLLEDIAEASGVQKCGSQ